MPLDCEHKERRVRREARVPRLVTVLDDELERRREARGLARRGDAGEVQVRGHEGRDCVINDDVASSGTLIQPSFPISLMSSAMNSYGAPKGDARK